jgi:hypothetical protein
MRRAAVLRRRGGLARAAAGHQGDVAVGQQAVFNGVQARVAVQSVAACAAAAMIRPAVRARARLEWFPRRQRPGQLLADVA